MIPWCLSSWDYKHWYEQYGEYHDENLSNLIVMISDASDKEHRANLRSNLLYGDWRACKDYLPRLGSMMRVRTISVVQIYVHMYPYWDM